MIARAACAAMGIVPRGRHVWPPPEARCKAKSKRTGGRCKSWCLKKPLPDVGYYPTCWLHGSHVPRGKGERKKDALGRVLGPRQWQRAERKWKECAAEYDASRVTGAAPQRRPATSLEAEFRGAQRPKKLPPLY
jgi:hypothetical protein